MWYNQLEQEAVSDEVCLIQNGADISSAPLSSGAVETCRLVPNS